MADPELDRLLDAAVSAVGGADRPGQREMAQAVAAAIGEGHHLLAQAGTGTGKSLAYLVPAVAYAVRSETPVVVSTATLALQAQIVDRDLPRVADALTGLLGRRPTWQLVKGRRNYLCRQKLLGGFPDDDALFDLPVPGEPITAAAPSSRLGREVVRLREWAESTSSGDRDELVPGVSERAWRQVSVSAHECLGAQRCPVAQECHSELARERARDVDLVVSNHAFVAIDSFEGRQMLPEHDVLVVDEAHELADRVTSVITDELTAGAFEVAARMARRAGVKDTSRLEQAGQVLEAALAEIAPGRLSELGEFLTVALSSGRDAARQLVSDLKPPPGESPDGARQVARAAVSEIHDVCERLTGDTVAGGSDVVWISQQRAGSGERTVLHVAPISVAMLLRDRLFADRTVVMTSATLTVGGSFDATAGSVGLLGEAAPSWRGLDVGSPFDYARQGILYIARHLPAPGRDGMSAAVLDEIAELVEAAGGRALGLFSSRRAAELAAEEMRERLDLPVLCQGDDATPTLVREFAREARCSLFGTLSLWQGVDVPGSACQLVIVDRIPFPRPDDPLASARQDAVAAAGGNGFMTIAATQAALLMAQGVGRLIRTATDRGVVAVLDSRLATARYSGFLRASLPPFWTTTDRAVALEALRRIDSTAPQPHPVADPAQRSGAPFQPAAVTEEPPLAVAEEAARDDPAGDTSPEAAIVDVDGVLDLEGIS